MPRPFNPPHSEASGRWFLVIGENAGQLKPSAYTDAAEAEAICRAKNYEYASLGPWTVIQLVQYNPINNSNEE